MTRGELEDLLRVWQHERALPPADPDGLVEILLEALADHWSQTPVVVRHAMLAVAAVLFSAD